MSYAEYLRRKAATSQKVIDYQPKKVDASQFITQQRLAASILFRLNGREGAINNVSDPSGTGTTSNLKRPEGVTKVAGGYVPDASTYTAYVGGNAIGTDIGGVATTRNTKYVLPANVPAELCTNSYLNGPTAAKSAGDWTRSQAPCTNGREPHTASEVSPPLFVDNTIRLKNLTGCCANDIAEANHTHPADVPHNDRWAPRPEHGRGGIPVFTTPSPSDARKVGVRNPRKFAYVEKHHGNDLLVNPRRVPTDFVPTNGAPAHLKINDPRNYPVA
jgi:hypothetical protein